MAMRYDGSGLVFAKRIVFWPSFFDSEATGVFETASYCSGIVSVSSYGILKPGSSQHGKAVRASMAWNCVKRYGVPSFTVILYRPTAWRLYLFVKSMASVYLPGCSGSAAVTSTVPSSPLACVTSMALLALRQLQRSEGHVLGVEPERRRGFLHLQIDDHGSAVVVAARIGRERDGLRGGNDVIAEADRIRGENTAESDEQDEREQTDGFHGATAYKHSAPSYVRCRFLTERPRARQTRDTCGTGSSRRP